MPLFLLARRARSLRDLIDRTPRPFKTPAAGESSQAIAKPENSEDRPGQYFDPGEKEDQGDQPVGERKLRRGILHGLGLHELPRGFARSNGPMPTVERPVLGARRRGLPDGNDALLR